MIAAQQRAHLYDLVLRFNRRLEHITKRLAPELVINENHLLGELRARPAVTAHDLSVSLQMEKSMLSRMLAALEKRGLIEASVSKDDRRCKFLNLTAKGISALEQDNRVRDQQVVQCIAALNSQEQGELQRLLRALADGLNSTALTGAEWENPVKIEIRRLTRSLGMLGDDYLGCGMSVENCQILHLIAQSGGKRRMSELRQILPYEFSILSRMVTQLNEHKLLTKEPGENDKRQITLSMSELGAAKSAANLDIGGRSLALGMKDFSSSQVERLCELIEKFVSHQAESYDHSAIELLDQSDERRRDARAYILAQIVRRGLEREAPENIIGARSIVIVHFSDQRIDGAIELQEKSNIKIAFAKNSENLHAMLSMLFEEKRMRALSWDSSSKLVSDLNSFSDAENLGSVSAKDFRQARV